jgi:hypothetical protein
MGDDGEIFCSSVCTIHYSNDIGDGMTQDEKQIRKQLALGLNNEFRFRLGKMIHKSTVLDYILDGTDCQRNSWGEVVLIEPEPTKDSHGNQKPKKIMRDRTRGEKNWLHIQNFLISALLVVGAHFYLAYSNGIDLGWPKLIILGCLFFGLTTWRMETEQVRVKTGVDASSLERQDG